MSKREQACNGIFGSTSFFCTCGFLKYTYVRRRVFLCVLGYPAHDQYMFFLGPKTLKVHDIRAFLLGPKTKKVHHELLVATYLLGPLFTEIAKTLQSRSLDFQGNIYLNRTIISQRLQDF